MGIWEAMEYLNTLVDDSDPDTDLSQIEHLLQTAEAIRARRPSALVHPHGADPRPGQDPLPVRRAAVGGGGRYVPGRLRYSDKIVFPNSSPPTRTPANRAYQTPLGVYEEGCGLDKVHLSWGHDEYLYHVVKDYLPDEALYMIRYHSFYPWHKEGAYQHLMNERDREMCAWVRRVQSLRPVLQGRRPAGRGEGQAVLRGTDRRISSRRAALVITPLCGVARGSPCRTIFPLRWRR